MNDGHLFSPEKRQEQYLGPEAGDHSIGKNMRNLKLNLSNFLFHFGINDVNYLLFGCKLFSAYPHRHDA